MIYAINENKRHRIVNTAHSDLAMIQYYLGSRETVVKADADGWIPWAGGECPLPDGAGHEVMFRNRDMHHNKRPERWRWDTSPNAPYGIIAYRPIILNGQQESNTMTQEQSITLQPGDYVLTEGMTEDEYHAVAAAFMAAGAEKYGDDDKYKHWKCVGWYFGKFQGAGRGRVGSSGSRQLTIQQVLSATNSGVTPQQETPMHPTDRLAAARKALEAAQREYDAALAEHQADYPWLHGDAETLRDLPPEEWQVGDWVECVDDRGHGCSVYTKGRKYKITGNISSCGNHETHDDEGDAQRIVRPDAFRFHSRP